MRPDFIRTDKIVELVGVGWQRQGGRTGKTDLLPICAQAQVGGLIHIVGASVGLMLGSR